MPAKPVRKTDSPQKTGADHAHAQPAHEAPQMASAERVEALRRAFRSNESETARAELFEALIASAGEMFASDAGGAAAALGEAEALAPNEPLSEEWHVRMFVLHRAMAALTQAGGAHDQAVIHFKAGLSHLPTDLASAEREANAARLQLLVRLAHSRLALGQSAEVVEEMAACEEIMAVLDGQIPARALGMVRGAVLGNLGTALAMRGALSEAEPRFEDAIAVIDRSAAPELADLRAKLLGAWTGALRSSGRGADADAVLARLGAPAHGESHAHTHAHHHGHGHDHHGHHAHDHEHGPDCGCSAH